MSKKNELVFDNERLRIAKGELESFVNYPNHKQSSSFSKKISAVKNTRPADPKNLTQEELNNLDAENNERTEVTKSYLIELGMSEKLFDALSLKEITSVMEKLRGEDVNPKN